MISLKPFANIAPKSASCHAIRIHLHRHYPHQQRLHMAEKSFFMYAIALGKCLSLPMSTKVALIRPFGCELLHARMDQLELERLFLNVYAHL